MKIILSIKPEFANKIFEGDKKFEFRRSIFKNKNVSKVILYASAPISKVIGEFEIGEILFKDLNSLWKETKEYSGITEDYFYDYFVGKENGFALQVRRAKRYKKELVLKNLSEKYRHNPLLTIKKARCPNITYTHAEFRAS